MRKGKDIKVPVMTAMDFKNKNKQIVRSMQMKGNTEDFIIKKKYIINEGYLIKQKLYNIKINRNVEKIVLLGNGK